MAVFLQYVLPALIGGFAGFGGGYFTWDIDKRRDLRARRRALIDQWRFDLVPVLATSSHDVISPSGHPITTEPAYFSLRPHLSEGLRSQLDGRSGKGFEAAPVQITLNSNGGLRREVMSEIDALEKKWQLV